MKVSIMISIFFAMILMCQAAVAVEQFDLLPCTEGDGSGMLYCIEYDSVGDVSYLHDNITRAMTIKLPIQVLTQLWLNQGEIVIENPIGETINNGQDLTSSVDKNRWTVVFKYERVNSDVGKLHLSFLIKDVEYRDTQFLHMEIRTEDNIFASTKKVWFPVYGRPTDTSKGEVEDPSAILRAKIKALQNETEALQEKVIIAEFALIYCVNKYKKCEESKNDMSLYVVITLSLAYMAQHQRR